MNYFLILFCLFAIEITKSHAGDFLIKNKGYVDVQSGKIITGKYIYVQNRKIVNISSLFNSKNKIIIDLSNSFLLPGFIDSHAHLFVTQNIDDKNFTNALIRETKLTDDFRTKRAKDFLRQYLKEGFTSVFDLGNSGQFLDAKLRDELSEDAHFPTLYISGPGLAGDYAQFPPQTPETIVKREYNLISSNTDITALLNKYLNHKVDILKIYLDNSPGTGVIDEKNLNRILTNKLISNFKKVTFHSITPDGAALINKYKLQSAEHVDSFRLDSVSQINPSSLKFATATDLSKEALKEFNYYFPAHYIAQKNRTHYLNKQKNIRILFGPDFYFHKADADFNRAKHVKNSVKALSDAGLTPLEILRALTINPALSLSLEKSVGQIKTGAFANILATTINPTLKLEAIQQIHFIMNQGEVIQQ